MPDPLSFEKGLEQLPELRAVVFKHAEAGVPFAVVEQCLRHPRITSLSFAENSDWSAWAYTAIPRRPAEESYPNSLEQLSYASFPWKIARASYLHLDYRKEDVAEASVLVPLIFGMHLSAVSLSFPAELVPLARMAELPWPRLRDLTLTGRYSHASQASSVTWLVNVMQSPRSLSIQVGQLEDCPRPAVLLESGSTAMRALESLTLAYPDPDDAIFTVAGTSLKHLSLRDYPRHYVRHLFSHLSEIRGLAMPILSSSECLRILSRMSMPRLEHLELVYEGDDSEEELLIHITSAYPHLASLELHQYGCRPHGPATLRFVSIASYVTSCILTYTQDRISEIIRSLKTLLTLHLHLDYDHQDTKPGEPRDDDDGEDDPPRTRRIPARELVRYGHEILTILERPHGCYVLEELYLLYLNRDDFRHHWVRFLPSRYPGTEAERVNWDEDFERLYVVDLDRMLLRFGHLDAR